MFNFKWPYSNQYTLNLDWLLEQVKAIGTSNATLTEKVERLTRLIESIPGVVDNQSILTVGPVGCRFQTVKDAVYHARTFCTPVNRVLILIAPGYYTEDIDLAPNPGIDLMGYGAVIRSESVGYPHTALYTAGEGTFVGIRFEGTVTYAVHVEVQGLSDTTGFTRFFDCEFYSGVNSALGAGIGRGNQLVCNGCKFITPRGFMGLYLHNYPGQDNDTTAVFHNCDFATGGGGVAMIDDAAGIHAEGARAPMAVTFTDCIGFTDATTKFEFRKTPDLAILHYIPAGGNVQLRDCFGNNVEALNTMQYIPQLEYAGIAVSFGNTWRLFVPLDHVQGGMTVRPTQVVINGVGAEDASTFNVSELRNGFFLVGTKTGSYPAGVYDASVHLEITPV